MNSFTSVPTSELEELKRQAEEIKRKISELSAPVSIADKCRVMPYSTPRFRDSNPRERVVCDDVVGRDAWGHFLALGKMIHAKSGIFVERDQTYRGCGYVDEIGKVSPKKVSDLTHDEVSVSIEMLEKIITIYNDYMLKLHPCVLLKTRSGEMRRVRVDK